MCDQVCIIIPIYKNTIDLQTQAALKHNLKMAGKVPCYFVAPQKLKSRFYDDHFGRIPILKFPDKYFKNAKTYNKLMLMPSFYKCFDSYSYICICQTDALLLRNVDYLLDLTRKGFDYWGAPWYPDHRIALYKFHADFGRLFGGRFFKKYAICVGNGGLSLRHVKKTIQLLRRHPLLRRIWNQNEDYFFALSGTYLDSQYLIAPRHMAQRFSLETNMKEVLENGGTPPFGVHAWKKFYPQLLERTISDE